MSQPSAVLSSSVPSLSDGAPLDRLNRHSREPHPPRDAWLFLRFNNSWRDIMEQQTKAMAAAQRAQHIAAQQAMSLALSQSDAVDAAVGSCSSAASVWSRSLTRLAIVEIQLVMQFLPSIDLLHLARCSRQTTRAASSPFPWQAFVLRVRTDGDVLQVRGINASGFLRRAPLSLHWRAEDLRLSQSQAVIGEDMHGQVKDWLVKALGCVSSGIIDRPIHRIELSFPWTQTRGWEKRLATQVLNHPALQCLLIVRLDRAGWQCGDAQLLKAVASLPLLHTLHVAPDNRTSHGSRELKRYAHKRFDHRDGASSAWALLATCPGLTALSIADSGALAGKSRLPHVYACSKLQKLGVVWPSLYGLNWTLFFSAPAIQQLHSLSLDSFDADNQRPALSAARKIPEGAYEAGWSCMTRLRHLTLRHIAGIDVLLPSIASAPALESLTLFPGVKSSFLRQPNDAIPTPAVVSSLLLSSPRLFVTLQLLRPRNRVAFTDPAVLGYESAVLSDTLGRFKAELITNL